MKNVLLQRAMKLNSNRKHRKWWHRAVQVMTVVVVFCTTYALILPAITMESETICGMEPHVHGPECYISEPAVTFLCAGDDGGEMLHRHEESCYSVGGHLICPLTERPEHVHSQSCYTPVLVCKNVHMHDQTCAEGEVVAVLNGDHYEYVQVPCTKTTNDDHVHGDSCYGAGTKLQCDPTRFTAHRHSEECRVVGETEEILVCQLPEHFHQELCFPVEEAPEQAEIFCGSGIHTHGESCMDADGTLICSIPVHVHEAACMVAELDLTADVETPQQWEQPLKGLVLSGNWPKDVLTVAATQLGYSESEKNVVLENDRLMGYTRYGQWYGLPYGDWCAMYISFVLEYAGVTDYPLESSVTRWIEALAQENLYFPVGTYEPKPGDLVFFDYDQRKAALEGAPEIPVDPDHVGILVKVIPGTEETAPRIMTIEGNVEGKVSYVTYEADDLAILGYGKLPTGRTTVLEYPGEDYRVTVSFGAEAGIPETAVLAVREILPGTDEYNTYYQQSVAAMLLSATVQTEEELAVTFARFFDISFLVDGQIIEPAASVNVQISYADSIRQGSRENGVAVHFAAEGIEVLDAETSATGEESENVDTFEFSQNSFSVVGTVLSSYQRVVSTTATKVQPNQIDNTGVTLYVLYTQIGGKYYALDGNGNAIPITVNGNSITLGADASNDLFWTFKEASGNYTYNPIANLGTSRYLHPFNNGGSNTGITTSNPYQSSLEVSGDSFKIKGNGNYVRFDNATSVARAVTRANEANSFYAASVGQIRNVWFDGTNGGMMSYYGSDDTNIPALIGTGGVSVVTLPETWKSPTKYPYELAGWYNITTQTYHPVDPNDGVPVQVEVTKDTVFYADWNAATYDVGQKNEHVVDSLDTSSYITTYVFDYNVLFNVMSQNYTGTITSAGHSENWSMVNNGKVAYCDQNTLGFSFVDYDANGEFSYANGRDDTNVNRSTITTGILNEVKTASGGKDLLELLFDPETQVIGKNYVGTGNYLFQYMDSTTENYDGIHDGYYYLDARLNAASYNQSERRFYLYDYLERTSDSDKDGGPGHYSDFLPFNSPYIFGESDTHTADLNNNNRRVDYYEDSVRRPGWEYDAKEGGSNHPEYNDLTDAGTNYFFGIRTDIEFFLPNDTNTQDEYGNYGNISTRGEHMIFDFHGDDDVWVFVDGQLMLDIGGLHGVMYGQIDFSTGTIVTGQDGGATTTRSFHLSEGTHTMTVYYMERGSSQSNCAIYFNIAPRYDLRITKEDIYTANKLDGAVFSVYNDEAMTSPAQLWESEEAHKEDMADGVADHATNSFTVVDGVAKCWGISAGKTYYIRETTPPAGYPASDDIIRITLNNRGTATIETTTLNGPNGVETEGFAVIKQNVNDTLKIVALTVTNQKEGETTEVRVVKTWAAGSENLPESISVYLTADGVQVGRVATLTAATGWSYTWKGLPKYRDTGVDEEIVYVVREMLVPGFITSLGSTEKVENHIDWIQVDHMSDSKTYLLVHNGKALSYNGSFGWLEIAQATQESGKSAQWSVTTDHDGFKLKNGLGYTLTYAQKGFYGVNDDAAVLNQVFYYLNSRLMVHDHDVYYQFGNNGSPVTKDGLAFTLYQKEILTGYLTGITNTPVEEDEQTYVEVEKTWKDGNENHTGDSVTIRLLADGVNTGRTATLNAANGWKAGFYELPYYQADGTTQIHYTVEELPVTGYLPNYSGASELPGLPVTVWKQTEGLTADAIYRFLSGSNALAVAADHSVTGVQSNSTKEEQHWKVVNRNGKLVLQNVSTGRYLLQNSSGLSTTDSRNSASEVKLEGGKLKVGTQFLEIGPGYAQTTGNAANITDHRIFQKVETAGKPGISYTIINIPAGVELPMTGGTGTGTSIFGGLLILAAALIYATCIGQKRRKGGV